MTQSKTQLTSEAFLNRGHVLSPLPFAQNIATPGTRLIFWRTDACLSLLAWTKATPGSDAKLISGCALLFVGVFGVYYGDWVLALEFIASAILLFFILQAVHRVFRPALPIFFHRQRREVLFLRRGSRHDTESFIVDWESLSVYMESRSEARRHFNYLCFSGGNDDAGLPGKKRWHWEVCLSHGFDTVPLLREWEAIRRFMDESPDAYVPAKWGLMAEYTGQMRRLPALPEAVSRWRKPIPQNRWRQPSIKLRWYNAYLAAGYACKAIPPELSDTVEEYIRYPGDEEAAAQLRKGMLTPLEQDGNALPSLPML